MDIRCGAGIEQHIFSPLGLKCRARTTSVKSSGYGKTRRSLLHSLYARFIYLQFSYYYFQTMVLCANSK